MTARRPLVDVNGRTKELPAGDTIQGAPRYVPARLRNGTASNIPLNADGTIPAKLRDGTVSNIPVQA